MLSIADMEQLYKALSPARSFDPARLRRALMQEYLKLVVALQPLPGQIGARALLGMTSLAIVNYGTKTKGYVEDVVVLEKARGKGVASAILSRVVEEAKKGGAESLELTSNPTRLEAHRLYQKFGFVSRDTGVFRLGLS
jgi:GNAT superfamily N-acetyltransferase